MIDPYWKSRRLRNVIHRARRLTNTLVTNFALGHQLAFTKQEKKRMRRAAIRDLMKAEVVEIMDPHNRLARELEIAIERSSKRRAESKGDLSKSIKYATAVVDEWPEWKRNILGNSGKSSVSKPRDNLNEINY